MAIILNDHCRKKKTIEYKHWSKWMNSTNSILNKWLEADEEDNPFAYNETASVSLLCCAAGAAGLLGLADYRVEKAGGKKGRCDLWLSGPNREWAFEFKFFAPYGVLGSRMSSLLTNAESAAEELDKNAYRYAGLVTSNYYMKPGRSKTVSDRKKASAQFQRDFARSHVDYCWEFSNDGAGGSDAFIMFKRVR